MIQDDEWRLTLRELIILLFKGKNEDTSANYERVNWSRRSWNIHTFKSKTTKGKENCQWNEKILAIFVVNKQRKHSRSFGLTGYWPWPLIGKVFIGFIDIGKRMTTIMNLSDTLSGLQRSIQRFLSEGRSPFTVLSPFKRQLVTPEQYSSQHQQILLL